MSEIQAINDKLQGNVATYSRCGGVVNNQIRKGLLRSLPANFLKSVNIWKSYKQEGDCLEHFLRLLAVCWPGVRFAWNNHALACNFAKYSPIKKIFPHGLNNKLFLISLLTTPPHLKCVATLLVINLSLMACFADINVLRGSVATCARCGGIFNVHLTTNLPRNLLVNFFTKSVKIWQNYGHGHIFTDF